MKKSNGFTLVEVLAVISVLAVVSIFLIPTMMQSFYNAKEKLSDYELSGLEDAGKMYIADIDLEVTYYTLPSGVTIDGVTYNAGDKINGYIFRRYMSDNYSSDGFVVTIEQLVAGGYYDKNCKYAGTIKDSSTGERYTEDVDCNIAKGCQLKVGLELGMSNDRLYTITKGYKSSIYKDCKKQ